MKITVYTIPDCQFSKQEKEYLAANKLTYEEKNLEANREFLTEMMTLSNNFAGTPVTKIEKDDGKIEIMKGFTKDDFDKVFGLTKAEEPKAEEPALSEMNARVAAPTPAPVPVPQQPQPKADQPITEPEPPTPPAPPQPPPQPTPTQPKADQPVAETPPTDASVQQKDDQLKSVLADLQEKAVEPAAPQSPPATPPANLPNIPDFE